MPSRDPLTYPYKRGTRRLQNLKTALDRGAKRPPIGLTQGGSSRKFAGAKPAATNGLLRPQKRKK